MEKTAIQNAPRLSRISHKAILLIAITLIFITTHAWAWGYRGHILIAQLAYDNLSKAEQNHVTSQAQYIFTNLSTKMQHQLNKNYPNVTTFAKVAVLPDYWRNWNLQTVFKRNDATIPINLMPESHSRTGLWHYINQPWPNRDCHTIKKENVVWAIDQIEKAMRKKNSPQTQAVLMVFLEHLVGDAHQPLHTISRVNQSCQGDKGGNLFCVRKSRTGKCRQNLHQLWDKGVGYLAKRSNLANKAIRLEKEYPKQSLPSENDLNPQDWIRAEYQLAPKIYDLHEYQKPSVQYYRSGQEIARKQLALAGYRLAQLIHKTDS